jgi:hypothetical protein
MAILDTLNHLDRALTNSLGFLVILAGQNTLFDRILMMFLQSLFMSASRSVYGANFIIFLKINLTQPYTFEPRIDLWLDDR